MRKLLCFLFVSSAILLSNCVQDDLHKSVDQHRHSEDFLEGKTITVDQETLESIYAENGNLNNIFKNQFEKDLKKKYTEIVHSNDAEDIKKKKYEEALLKMMKKHKLELNIYFLDSNDGNFNKNWQQLSLNNGNIQYTNIN